MKINKSTGFTLIELIVVMGIIAILTSLSLFALPGARAGARDAKRKADLQQIAAALEIYKSDQGQYPPSPLAAGTSLTAGGNTYMEEIPGDPISGNYAYNRLSNVRYTLCSTLEEPPTPANDTSDCASCSSGACEYKITNP